MSQAHLLYRVSINHPDRQLVLAHRFIPHKQTIRDFPGRHQVIKFKQFEKLGRIAGIVLLTASSNISLAQDDNDQDVSSNGDWEFTLSPLFLWGMGISGDATIGDKTAPTPIACCRHPVRAVVTPGHPALRAKGIRVS